jgi:lysophospholipase L1-like esterase
MRFDSSGGDMMRDNLSRRGFLQFSVLGATAVTTGSAFGQEKPAQETAVWHDVREWGVEGKGWPESDTEKYFDRLPKRAKGVVRDAVWNLSRHSAGMLTRFRSDATEIWVDYKVTSPKLAMPHMPATGVSGIDLYATDDQGESRWLAVSRPTEQTIRTKMITAIIPGVRDFTAYLPLYNGTESLKIGVPKGASFEPIAPRSEKPILFYGTSITHGACASRPGMPHPAILGRRFDRPVINLGFSGNGKMEKEVGQFLCELDPVVYVIDCLPNMVGREVAERAEPLVRQLREARPDTPILLVEDRTYANTPFILSKQERHKEARGALRQAYNKLIEAGFKRLGYVEGESLLGDDRDDTTDGSHPNDLGFFRQANALEPALRELGA